MLDFLNRTLLHPLAAFKAGSRHLQHLKYLRRSQFDPPSVVRGRQLTRLKTILQHAYDTVPFYRETWDTADVHPSDLKSLKDLKQFPIVTKPVFARGNGNFFQARSVQNL